MQEDIEVVCFDLEATGFAKEDQIIQIAACTTNSSFNVYITPTRPIHWKASEITGLKLFNGNLYLHGKRVNSVPARVAFKRFMNYLRNINKDIILIAHNCFGFDMPKILDLADALGLRNEFTDVVNGFSDSLVILRSALQNERGGKGSFTFEALVQDYLPDESVNNLHNAEHDARLLLLLLFNSELNISEEEIIQSSRRIEKNVQTKEPKMQGQLIRSLEYCKNILPNWVVNKMIKTKIDGNLLRQTYEEDGFEGIRKLFSEDYCGTPRVTRNRSVIHNVCESLNDYLYDTDDD